jgi:hypothetical protein
MQAEAIIQDPSESASLLRGRAAVPERKKGVFYHWGPQAWIDMWMSRSMIVKKAWPLVSHTIVPILRLSTDADRIDAEYEEIRSRREKIRWSDSPRDRWRKNYGNFVREAEWGLLELRKHFTREQYEEIIVGTSVALAHEESADFLEMMNSMANQKPPKKGAGKGAGPQKPKGLQKLAFDMFNPAGFLTGPAEVTEFDLEAGSVTMEIPDCAWHICAAHSSGSSTGAAAACEPSSNRTSRTPRARFG